MADHAWEIEAIDCGHMGVNTFHVCRRCGASGGPAIFKRWPAFLAGTGLQLSEDCDAAKKAVDAYQESDS